MNIFEDLIEELKGENLLEETVIEVHKDKPAISSQPVAGTAATEMHAKTFPPKNNFQPPAPLLLNHEADFQADDFPADETIYSVDDFVLPVEPAALLDEPAPAAESLPEHAKKYPEVERRRIFVSEKEYFRKRAMDEVTGLQMVDHVLSGVEREQMKLVPKPYDDLPVKLALHDFMQVAHETTSTEHAQAEFRLMQETENWCSALAHRDKHISIAHLRRYCETSRPALSPQALIALARFYRNSPFSESVRSKFELVITRLFTRENDANHRWLLLTRDEMIEQLKELYADWSSIQLYSSDEEDPEILIAGLKFVDFVNEAENRQSFEEMIANDFFNRLRLFKQNCNENFFAPSIAVSAVEANVKIGNRYLELLAQEKEKFNAATIEEKYGFLHDQAISDATGKTFQLAMLLSERSGNPLPEAAEIVEVTAREQEPTRVVSAPKTPRSKFFAINKWLLGATILTIFVCIGLFFWAEHESREIKPSPTVKKVNLENSEFKDFIQTGRIDEDTFYGITTGAWESLTSEKKQEILKKLLSVGTEKNYKKVILINNGGKSVGFASPEKVESYNQ